MARHPVWHHFPLSPVQGSPTRLILMHVRALGALLIFSFLGLLTGCSGLSSSESKNSTAPTITTQPASQTVTAGQTATFTVAATGTAPLSFQWKKNGTVIAGATSSSYTTPPTTSSDNGSQLTVVISNTAGSVTSNAVTLTVSSVAVAPSITTQPASQTVTSGQTATFAVVATGTAPLSYQWKKNGTAIAGATSSSYTTPPTTSSDNGSQLTVVISNTAGSVTSNAATLTVSSVTVAPTITTQPASQTVTVGQTATFTVVATGTAPLSYQWKKNGTAIAGATSSSYTTPPTTSSDNGAQFTVVVSNTTGSVTGNAATLTVSPASAPFGHVFIVVEENHSYSSVIGSSSMPYLNSLAAQYGLATQYYANTHPSIGNYFMLTTGQIITIIDSMCPTSFPVSADNVVRELLLDGKTWKDYAEDLPAVGSLSCSSGNYVARHNPFPYFTDVQNSSVQIQNLVPFRDPNVGFAHDLAANTFPNYSFIVPNLNDDAHNGTLGAADTWLQNNIDPLVKSAQFQADGLLVIVFDESAPADTTHGGGHVAWVVVSPKAKAGYKSTTLYQHQSTLRLMLEGLGIQTFPGAGATAPTMWEFFTFPPPP
jgi:invasion protein IalB